MHFGCSFACVFWGPEIANFLKPIRLLCLCKLQKCKFVKPVMLYAYVLHVRVAFIK